MIKRLTTATLAALPLALSAAPRPNVILIMTDQHSSEAMSCAGCTDVATPAMDCIASHGTRFESTYCAMPLSGPSRAAMFTGYFPSQSGMVENEMPLVDSLRASTLGTLVADAGYDCVYGGKWHVNTISIPEGEFGFHRIAPNGDRGLAEKCVEYLQRDHSKPFFMVASFQNPHDICQVARGQKTPHADVEEGPERDWPALPYNFEVAQGDAKVLQFEKKQNYSLYPSVDFDESDWRHYRYMYFRLIEAVDCEIGKIVDEIDRQNLWKNTIVIFTADHGDGMGAHMWNQKTVLYEEVARVPMIVALPGRKDDGKVSKTLVNNGEDLMPTICALTGATMPEGRQGKNFLETQVPYVVAETNFLQTAGTLGWMVRTPRYKYVLYDKGKNREGLYDLSTDPGEMNNLALDPYYKEELQYHRNALREWMSTHPAPKRERHINLIP